MIRDKIKNKLSEHLGYTPTNEITDYIIKLIAEELPRIKPYIKPDMLRFNEQKRGWNDCLALTKQRLGIIK